MDSMQVQLAGKRLEWMLLIKDWFVLLETGDSRSAGAENWIDLVKKRFRSDWWT
jgi:hypothetical protein